jgi:hypothetical protein
MAENTDICFSGRVLLKCNAEIRDDRQLERPFWTSQASAGSGPPLTASTYISRFSIAATGTLEAVNRHHNVRALKHLNKPFENPPIIMRPGLQKFFKDTMRVAHRLKRHGHQRSLSWYLRTR